MQATIRQWGNSLALRLPRHVTEEVKLVDGTTVDVEIEDGTIKVTPTRPRFKLADLLKDERRSSEFDWGKQRGDEAW